LIYLNGMKDEIFTDSNGIQSTAYHIQ